MKRSAVAGPATPRSCRSSSIRRKCPTSPCCASSGRATIRRRACDKATTWAPSTARPSTATGPPSRRRRRPPARRTRRSSRRRVTGPITTEIRRPPSTTTPETITISTGEESLGLLRRRRHRAVACPTGLCAVQLRSAPPDARRRPHHPRGALAVLLGGCALANSLGATAPAGIPSSCCPLARARALRSRSLPPARGPSAWR